MKIYKHYIEPKEVLRVRIYKESKDAKYITLQNISADEFLTIAKDIISAQNLSPFQTGKRTSIEAREAIGAKNGKAKSIGFKGLNVDETYDLIMEYILANESKECDPIVKVHQKAIEDNIQSRFVWVDVSESEYNSFSGKKRILYHHI